MRNSALKNVKMTTRPLYNFGGAQTSFGDTTQTTTTATTGTDPTNTSVTITTTTHQQGVVQ